MARARVASVLGEPPLISVRELRAADLGWAEAFLGQHVGGRHQARRGELMDALEGGAGAGLVASVEGGRAGLVTWAVVAGSASAEVRALAVDPALQGRGVGRALLDGACDALRTAGVERAWLITTNDNLAALALYQKAGWRLAALRPGAIDEARRTLKPSIPEVADNGIPIRDELELERVLSER